MTGPASIPTFPFPPTPRPHTARTNADMGALTTRIQEQPEATSPTSGLPECITQDPREPASRAFLDICAVTATEIADSVYCPPECGGHPICKPCLALALELGLVVVR